MISRWIVGLSFGLCLSPLAAVAEEAPSNEALTVKAELMLPNHDGSTEVAVGEPVTLVIEARHAPGGLALLPEELGLPETIAERRNARTHQRSSDAKGEIDRYQLELIGFEPGDLEIPAIPLALGSTHASTRALTMPVGSGLSEEESVVASSTQAAAIAELEKIAAPNPPPRAITVSDYGLLWVAGGLATVLLLGFALRRFASREQLSTVIAPPPVPPRPAEEVALERLARLKSAGHLERGEHKAFWVELSEILRAYAGGRYGFESIELTVPELIDALKKLETPGLDLTVFKQVLEEGDLVKFAKWAPTDLAGESALNQAFAIVERTKPMPAPAPSEGRAG